MHFHGQNLHHHHREQLQQQAGKTHMTGENYSSSNRMAGAAAALNNALVNVKTSDLGDELPVNECENNIHALCHVAHLTLIDGCDNVAAAAIATPNTVGLNLDSDGMSSETQRSFTTNGSPSSGIAEMEHTATTCQQHNRILGQPLQLQALTSASNFKQANHHHLNATPDSTTSNEHKQEQFDSKVGGNIIGVNKQQTAVAASNLDEIQTMHNFKPNQKVNSFKNGRKIVSTNPD